MPVRFEVDFDSVRTMAVLDAMPASVDAEGEKAMVVSSHLVEAEVKALTPRRTGRLFSAWRVQTRGLGFEATGVISNNVGYAGYVESGTDAHEIVARGRALVIPITRDGRFGGGTLSGRPRAGQQFALFKRVRHPGSQGRHMAELGLAAAKPLVFAEFRRSIKRAIELALSVGK